MELKRIEAVSYTHLDVYKRQVVGYAETSMSRRQYLLYYFGEEFDPINGDGAKMDDNSVNPPKLKDASKDVYKRQSLKNLIFGKMQI